MQNEIMADVMIFVSIIAPTVAIVMQLLKKYVANKFIPLASVIAGMAIGSAAFRFTELPIDLRIWGGFIAGASASGLYSLIKTGKK